MTDIPPGVTVVVPTLNRGDYLLDTVRDLLAQTHRPLEILIVDQSDAMSSGVEKLVAAHPGCVRHHRVAFRGLPNARNYGWQHARHELVVFVDDDIRCGSRFIEGYTDDFRSADVAICGGGVDEPGSSEDEALPRYNRWLAFPEGGFASWKGGRADHVKGCNFAARRDVLEAVGGFDERLNVGAALQEETELCLRAIDAGHVIQFEGAARLTHLAAGGGGTRQSDWRRYAFALAHNRSILIRRHSRWYQWPLGLAWSGKLIAAYSVHYRNPRILVAGLRGMVAGWRAGGLPPLCTHFASDGP